MTANTTDVYPDDVRASGAGDEIDLRIYFVVLLRWWKEILLVGILFGALAWGGISFLNSSRDPIYSANADILVMRMLTSFDIDARVNTSFADRPDLNSWRASLSQLVSSPIVAEAVLAELGDQLPSNLRTPQRLASRVSATVPLSTDERFTSNIIRLTVESDQPELSALIANSWAKHYVNYVNGLFGEVPESMIESVNIEHSDAMVAYQGAEDAYQDWVANNQVEVLNRQILEKSAVRNELIVNYTRMLSSVVSVEYNAQLNLYDKLLTVPSEQAVHLVNSQVRGNVASLDSLYNMRTAAMSQLNQARNMERVLIAGGEASAKTNVAALQLLKLTSLSALQGYGSLPSNLSLSGLTSGITMTLDEQLVDVRSLITVLEAYVTQLNEEILNLSESPTSGSGVDIVGGSPNAITIPTIAPDIAASTPVSNVVSAFMQLVDGDGILNQSPVDINSAIVDDYEQLLNKLESDIRTLQAQLAAERSTERQLTHERDVAWTTYDTVGSKLQELRLLRAAANSEVRLGNMAMTPLKPEPAIGKALPTVAAIFAGVIMAVLLALLLNSFGVSPFLSRRTA